MDWKIAQAKEKFSELIRKSQKEPQVIYSRDKVVAAVISSDEYLEYKKTREDKETETLASRFRELRDICKEEDYEIKVPERENRDTGIFS